MNKLSTDQAKSLVDEKQLLAAMQRAGREAIRQHALAGRSIPVWQDGRVVWIPPEVVLALPPSQEKG